LYQEPTEPKIVTEEISDPWEKRKLKELEDEKKIRKKSKPTKKDTHVTLHKENSNGSSVEDDHQEEKPHGFTTVEKVKNRKRMEYSGHGTMDKLDEISLNGPRPDAYPRKTTARQEVLKNNKMNRAKKTAYHHEKERLTSSDTPTSPHAIAAAIVEAALHKSQQKKKSAGNSPSNSNHTSPKHSSYEEKESKSKKSKKDSSSGGITSYLKKMIGGAREHSDPDSPTQTNGNSMFYYDNLSSLRNSKKPSLPRPKELERTTSSPSVGGFSSNLSPEVPEFVPASQRINKAPGSNVKKDNSWASVDDSALEYLRPPPGLSKPASTKSTQSIWGLENPRTSTADSWTKSSLFSDLKTDSYSALLGNTSPRAPKSTSFGSLLTGSRDERDGGDIWKSDLLDKDLFGSSTSLGRSSIWDAPDIPTSSSGTLSARGRLGLGLDLNPVSEVGNSTDSPLDAFSIWASNASNESGPYSGWNKDLKDD